MKQRERVKSNILFNHIINNGQKVSNNYFTIFFLAKDDIQPLFGIAVSKKIGNAVVRNRLKRQLRSMVAAKKLLFKNKQNYIIIGKMNCLKSTYKEMFKAFQDLIGDINETK